MLGGSHQILDGHVFGLGMTNYTIKKSYTIRFATMNSEKTLQSKKTPQYIYIYVCIYIYIYTYIYIYIYMQCTNNIVYRCVHVYV